MPSKIIEMLQAYADARTSTAKRRCEHCNIEFKPRRSDARFCSDACMKKAWLGRHRESRY